MVSVTGKPATKRSATAVARVVFSSLTAVGLVRDNALAKGDVLGVARIAGIMAAKRASDLVPLCHPIALEHVSVDVQLPDDVANDYDGYGGGEEGQKRRGGAGAGEAEGGLQVKQQQHQRRRQQATPTTTAHSNSDASNVISVSATVTCTGPTGVEMEALAAAAASALTIYDMCKAVDRGIVINDLRVVHKSGGRSGTWVEGVRIEDNNGDDGGNNKT